MSRPCGIDIDRRLAPENILKFNEMIACRFKKRFIDELIMSAKGIPAFL
jgi:hypothetical protein